MRKSSASTSLTQGLVVVLGMLTLTLCVPAWAQIVTPDPSLPPLPPQLPAQGGYANTDPIFSSYGGAALQINLNATLLRPIALNSRTIVNGTDELESFQSTLGSLVDVFQGGVPVASGLSVTSSGLASALVHNKAGHVTGTFNTEMLSLDLSGVTPLGPFMLRESPTLQSLGQTTITDIGGGLFRIDSFFDIFTELSIDGGATWMPDTVGPAHVNLVVVPEPGTLALLVAGLGLCLIRRRR